VATDIGSLAAGLDARDYEKHIEALPIFSVHSLFSIVDSVATALLNITTGQSTSLGQLTLILLVPLTSSSLLHSVAHYTRLAISSPVHTFAVSPPPHIAQLSLIQPIKLT
jgi:hypothetical protein